MDREKKWFAGARGVVVATAVLLALPFFLNVNGDAQVHLAVAERFAAGRPFRYNPGGEWVVASTSPFWTMWLTATFWLVGRWTPLLLKVAVTGIWAATGYALYRLAREQWGFVRWRLWAVVGLWLTHTIVVANALSGLENVLSALQLVVVAYWVARWRDGVTDGRGVVVGLLLGWMALTRPDGGLFGAIVVGLWVLAGNWGDVLLREGETSRGEGSAEDGGGFRLVPPLQRFVLVLRQLVLVGGAAVVVWLPWHLFQFGLTGNWLTDSSLARLYNGRQGAFFIAGLHVHPKALLSLATAFLPLSFGVAVVAIGTIIDSLHENDARVRERLPMITAVSLLAVALFFYTFIVGAEAFGRYFLPLYPFLFLVGVAGLDVVYRWLRQQQVRLAQVFVALAALFMVGTSGVDAVRRLGNGRFAIHHVLDVIYGPAHRRYTSFNLDELIAAPQQRTAHTDELLQTLAAPGATQTTVAVTEVQLRYFLDDRVNVLSLDGRTSASILPYYNETTGVPDFAAYFTAQRPDFVHVNQWCRVGGWLATVFPAPINDNLVCAWQERAARMAVGDSFTWNGRRVILVAPEIVRIEW